MQGIRVIKQGLAPDDIEEGINQFDLCMICVRNKKFDMQDYGVSPYNDMNFYKEMPLEYTCNLCGEPLTSVVHQWWTIGPAWIQIIPSDDGRLATGRNSANTSHGQPKKNKKRRKENGYKICFM